MSIQIPDTVEKTETAEFNVSFPDRVLVGRHGRTEAHMERAKVKIETWVNQDPSEDVPVGETIIYVDVTIHGRKAKADGSVDGRQATTIISSYTDPLWLKELAMDITRRHGSNWATAAIEEHYS